MRRRREIGGGTARGSERHAPADLHPNIPPSSCRTPWTNPARDIPPIRSGRECFFVEPPECRRRQRRGLREDNGHTVPQQSGVQFSPWDVADDGAFDDVVCLGPADHSWAARERVFRLQRATLFNAIRGTPLAALSRLNNVLRVRRQLPHEGFTEPGSSFPALVEIFVGGGQVLHPL